MDNKSFDILVCSADPNITEALESIVYAINCQPILLKDYSQLKNVLKKEVKALFVDEIILYKNKKVNIKTVYKKFKLDIPIFCLIENIYGLESNNSLIHFFEKPIDKITFKNALEPYLSNNKNIEADPLIKIGKLNFDKNLNILIGKNKKIIYLTNLESKLLLTLFINSNKALNEDYLLKNVWGYSSKANSNTLKTHIWRLRKKISKNPDIMFELETVNNGYVFKEANK